MCDILSSFTFEKELPLYSCILHQLDVDILKMLLKLYWEFAGSVILVFSLEEVNLTTA